MNPLKLITNPPGFFADLIGSLGFKFIDRVFTHLEARANSDNERLRIQEGRAAANDAHAAQVVMAGMQHKAFWIPWSIAAVPAAMWFGWGMLDSLFNGALPDVATLPPQLLRYADVVFGNIFYAGGAAAGAQILANAIRGRK